MPRPAADGVGCAPRQRRPVDELSRNGSPNGASFGWVRVQDLLRVDASDAAVFMDTGGSHRRGHSRRGRVPGVRYGRGIPPVVSDIADSRGDLAPLVPVDDRRRPRRTTRPEIPGSSVIRNGLQTSRRGRGRRAGTGRGRSGCCGQHDGNADGRPHDEEFTGCEAQECRESSGAGRTDGSPAVDVTEHGKHRQRQGLCDDQVPLSVVHRARRSP